MRRYLCLPAVAVWVVFSGWMGCASEDSDGGRSTSGSVDPVREELGQLESIAHQLEQEVDFGGDALAAMAEQLELRLTEQQISALARNYLAMMEAYSSQEPWQPDADFYDLVDAYRDLPFLSGMPARATVGEEGAMDDSGKVTRGQALFLANATPVCGFSCEAQGTLYGLLDLGASGIKRYYVDILTSGVDCLQFAGRLGQCAAPGTCSWGDLTQFFGDCAAFTVSAGIAVSPVGNLRTTYVFMRTVLSLWSTGSLSIRLIDWISTCKEYQSTSCNPPHCADGEKPCLAVNGAASSCCPIFSSCIDCGMCDQPCGAEGCCSLGQRCDDGQCSTCFTACGDSCCTRNEVCSDPQSGRCEPCDNSCGFVCCSSEEVCLESMHDCCGNPCGSACCGSTEVCIEATLTCCEVPCGSECCDPDQVCRAGRFCDYPLDPNPGSDFCENPPAIDCAVVCEEAIAVAIADCAEMGGTLGPVNIAECIAACQCRLEVFPGLAACYDDPTCPGCTNPPAELQNCASPSVACIR